MRIVDIIGPHVLKWLILKFSHYDYSYCLKRW
jgi:hypothetical protein